MKKKYKRLKIVGCIPLDQEGVGFAVPVLIHPTDPRFLVVQEVDELSGRVCGFRILEHQKSQLIHVADDSSVGIGEEQLYAFFITPNNVSIGTLAMLRAALEQFAETNPSRSGLILQIKELIGSDQEKKVARARMRRLLLDAQGTAAARSFYEGSVLRSVLWSRLLSMATSKEMSKRILQVRGRLSAGINQDGQIVLDLTALSEEDRVAIDDAKLISAMLLEFEPRPPAVDKPASLGEDEAHNAARIQRRVEDLLSLVRRTGRQEERVALLMAAILNDPTVGKSALLQYQRDRASTAAWAIAELRKIFIDTSWPSDEQVIAALVPRLFTKHWPMTRGDLLFFLAKHLGKWPQVNTAIREVLRRTNSAYVHLSRKEIEDALAARQSKLEGVARRHYDLLPDA
jgi:hypothetical protein